MEDIGIHLFPQAGVCHEKESSSWKKDEEFLSGSHMDRKGPETGTEVTIMIVDEAKAMVVVDEAKAVVDAERAMLVVDGVRAMLVVDGAKAKIAVAGSEMLNYEH